MKQQFVARRRLEIWLIVGTSLAVAAACQQPAGGTEQAGPASHNAAAAAAPGVRPSPRSSGSAAGTGVARGAATDGLGADNPPPGQVKEARALAGSFMKQLKGALKKALADGGPAGAIAVCREAAPGIAGQLSEKQGWAVGRTALRVRNPRNAPSPRERAVMLRFQQRAAAGEPLMKIEEAAVLGPPGGRYLHYMKAIPTGGVCLTCHGEELPEDVAKAVAASYPADAATGFEKGELRGAFTFVKPL